MPSRRPRIKRVDRKTKFKPLPPAPTPPESPSQAALAAAHMLLRPSEEFRALSAQVELIAQAMDGMASRLERLTKLVVTARTPVNDLLVEPAPQPAEPAKQLNEESPNV